MLNAKSNEQGIGGKQRIPLQQVCCSVSCVQHFVTPWTAAHQASRSFTVSQNLHRLMSFESMMPSNHLILCHPLLLLPSAFPSIRVFSSESALCIRWPMYWSFNFSISPSIEYSGFPLGLTNLISLLSKSLLHHHNLKASILLLSGFFMVQLSHPYRTTGKTIALTIWTFVGEVMSVLFNTLSRFIIAFLPRTRSLLISWL